MMMRGVSIPARRIVVAAPSPFIQGMRTSVTMRSKGVSPATAAISSTPLRASHTSEAMGASMRRRADLISSLSSTTSTRAP